MASSKAYITCLPQFEIQKIIPAESPWSRYIQLLLMRVSLRRQGYAVTMRKSKYSYYLFNTRIHKISEGATKIHLFEDLCFQAIFSFYPKLKGNLVCLLIPIECGELSVSIFDNGILYYKRTLFPGSDLNAEIKSTIKYVKKFEVVENTLQLLWVSKNDLDMSHLYDFSFKRVNANPNELVRVGLKSKNKLTLNPPFTHPYIFTMAQDLCLRSLLLFSMPLCLFAVGAFVFQESIYPQEDLDSAQRQVEVLNKSLHPKEILDLLDNQTFSHKPILQQIKNHLHKDHLPHLINIDFEKRAAEFSFKKPHQVQPSMKTALSNYKISKEGTKLVLKEKQ